MKLRKSLYGLNFCGMMQFTMKCVTVWNGHTQLIFAFSDLGRRRMLSYSERLVFYFESIVPRRFGCNFRCAISNICDWCLSHIAQISHQVNPKWPHWSQVNTGLGNGLVPSGNKPLTEPVLTKFYDTMWHHQAWNKSYTLYYMPNKPPTPESFSLVPKMLKKLILLIQPLEVHEGRYMY